MNLLPNKRELEEALDAIRPLAENAGYKIAAITASTVEYPVLKAYAFGSKAEFIAIDTGHERLLMNVTGNGKGYTVDQFAKVYVATNPQTSYSVTASAKKSLTECLVRSRTHVNQICRYAFGE